jgi:hypothetical protein
MFCLCFLTIVSLILTSCSPSSNKQKQYSTQIIGPTFIKSTENQPGQEKYKLIDDSGSVIPGTDCNWSVDDSAGSNNNDSAVTTSFFIDNDGTLH